MDPRLTELLRQVSAAPGNQGGYTTCSYLPPSSEWVIQNNKLSDYWEHYCDLVENPKGHLALGERTSGNIPVVLHGRLRFHHSSDEASFYDVSFLMAFVRCCQQVLEQYLNITAAKAELIACVLTCSEEWQEGDSFVTQFRIQFPHCRVSLPTQMKLLRPRIIQLLRTSNVMGLLGQQPIGDWEQIIDPSIPQDHLPLYGAVMTPQETPLSLTYIWPQITEKQVKAEVIDNLSLEEAFVPTNHTHVQQGLVNVTLFTPDQDVFHWVPLYLSAYYWQYITTEKVDSQTLSTGPMTITTSTTPYSYMDEEDSDLALAERFLPMLDLSRADAENYWLDVGRALYHASRESERGLDLWIQFTERSDNHTAEDCRNLYCTFSDSGLTVKTLAWYAREDKPDAYKDWHTRWCQKAMERASSGLHSDVAEALRRFYWLEFACASVSSSTWYQFREGGNRWFRMDAGHGLSKNLSSDFLKHFEQYRINILRTSQDSNDQEVKDKGELMNKKLSTLIGKLKTVSYKANIMKEARELFYDETFATKLDKNENCLGMTNCVLETCGNQVISRKGKPEDYISMSTNIPYRRDYTFDHPTVKNLLNWLHQVFVDEELFHYVMKDFSSFLKGRNSEKIFRVWTGEGDNSKSMIVKLFEAAFGNYVVKIPVELVLAKRQSSGSATPELAQTKGTHGGFMEEPDDDEPMRKGMIKRFTGGDSFFGRFLHDNGGKIDAFFKLVLMCNKVPSIPNGDRAIRNRFRIIPFFSKWVSASKAPATVEEQFATRTFKKDPFFERKIPEMASAFIWLLTQYYPKYVDEGLADEPTVVVEETKKYWDNNDCHQMFASECLETAYLPDGKTLDETAMLKFTDVWSVYKPWFKDNFPNVQVGKSTDNKPEFIRVLGPLNHQGRWRGIRLKEMDAGFTAGDRLVARGF